MIKLKFHFLLLPIVVYTREYLLICFPKFELSQFISCGHEEYPLKLAHKFSVLNRDPGNIFQMSITYVIQLRLAC
jgi:hypothetical protein